MFNRNRFDKLYEIMRQANLDIIALIPGPNHRYLFDAVHFVLERPIVTFIALGKTPSPSYRNWKSRCSNGTACNPAYFRTLTRKDTKALSAPRWRTWLLQAKQ